MTRVVLAEKPSVAADIAKAIGASSRRDGYFEGGGYQVTWAVGHLVGLAEPGVINAAWQCWDAAALPMLPISFPLVPRDGLKDRLALVRKLFNAKSTQSLICATDAGREGELIFRLIYEAVGCTKPVERLWIASLTGRAIEEGFRKLKPASAYDALAAAARARSVADWLVGMNLSRAYSIASRVSMNVGRVKTPTLTMVVARDIAIELFKPAPYLELEACFASEAGEIKAAYVHLDYDKSGKPFFNRRLPPTGSPDAKPELEAERIVARATAGSATVRSVDQAQIASHPPELFDLTELQRVANRLWNWTAQQTLGIAQELYEKHKVLSYPRTDSRHLSKDVERELDAVLDVLRPIYGPDVPQVRARAPLSRRFVNDGQVTDHHAIIPTATVPSLQAGSPPALLYDLVSRRLLSAWQPDAIDATTLVHIAVTNPAGEDDRYEAKGKAMVARGWRAVDLPALKKRSDPDDLPAGLRAGMPCGVAGTRVVPKETRPPDYFSEATLLSAMERAGASLEGELSKAMRDRGLGTPATRASTIEELVAKSYLRREGKSVRSTELGRTVVRRVHPHVASPALTGEWEAKLRRVERGELDADVLLAEVRTFVTTTVRAALLAPPIPEHEARRIRATVQPRADIRDAQKVGPRSAKRPSEKPTPRVAARARGNVKSETRGERK